MAVAAGETVPPRSVAPRSASTLPSRGQSEPLGGSAWMRPRELAAGGADVERRIEGHGAAALQEIAVAIGSPPRC